MIFDWSLAGGAASESLFIQDRILQVEFST